ncbi:MAG: hypothetical protein ACUVTZ_01150 [Armatimonadota bacterium]
MPPSLSELLSSVRSGGWDVGLGVETAEAIRLAPEGALHEAWPFVSGPMIRFTKPLCGPLFRLRCVADWKGVMDQARLGFGTTVVEVASGASDPVPAAAAIAVGPSAHYVSANLNKRLTNGLRRSLQRLPITWQIVEDDAAHLNQHVPPGTADLVAFHHAVNDVVQTIIFSLEGRDTVEPDWGEVLPDMVRLTAQWWADGRLESLVRPEFMKLIAVCTELLRPGGVAAFTHHMYEVDISLGYPMELYSQFIPLARRWMSDGTLPLREVQFEGYDAGWWLFLIKE